jgi:hypothetical protein
LCDARPVQMNDLPEIAIFIAILALIVFIAVISHRMEKQRRAVLAAFARSQGLDYYPDRDGDFPEAQNHHWFNQGHSRYAKHRIEGIRDIRGERFVVKMGEYHWTTGSGKHKQHHSEGYLLIKPTWPALPNLLIRPETFFDKIGDALGFDDIDFESAEFSRKFMVKSTDKRFAYAVVHQRMMEFLMSDGGYSMDLNYGECLFRGLGSRPKPDDFHSALGWAERFFEQWPTHLVREVSGR